MSRVAWSIITAQLWRLYLDRYRRHYLPCRTMSSSLDRNYKRLRNKESFLKNTRATRHSQRGLQAVQEPQQIVVGLKAG